MKKEDLIMGIVIVACFIGVIIVLITILSTNSTYVLHIFNGFKISDAILYNLAVDNCETHNISDFYVLGGNHDGEKNDKGYAGIIWKHTMCDEPSFSIYIGNVQIIMNSVIFTSDKKYDNDWLLNEIDESYNVIVCRHHNNFPIDALPRSVFCLVHGHTHYQGIKNRIKEYVGFKIIDVSGIDFCHSGNSGHSYLFTFTNGSNDVMVMDFNHSNNLWSGYVVLYMNEVFVYEDDVVRVLFCSDLHIGNVECGLLHNFNWVRKCFRDFDVFPSWKFCCILGDVCDGESLYYLRDKNKL